MAGIIASDSKEGEFFWAERNARERAAARVLWAIQLSGPVVYPSLLREGNVPVAASDWRRRIRLATARAGTFTHGGALGTIPRQR